MDSLQKLNAALQGAEGFEPEDEQTARMMQTLAMAKPLLVGMIPGTAPELDAQLLGISRWLMGLHSDSEDPNIRGWLATIAAAIEEMQSYSAESLTALEGRQA